MRRGALSLLMAPVFLTTLGLLEGNALADNPACKDPKTTCSGHSGYYASADDLNRLTAVADPILRDVRACLDSEGGRQVASVLVIRWNSDGQAVDVKIDVPGYESLACVQRAKAKLTALQNPHETAIRCEYGCPKPAPPPPVAPVVMAPVTTPPPAPVAATPAPAPPPAPPPVAAPEKHYEKTWYGYQTLIADAIAIPTFLAGYTSETKPATTAGYVGFLLGAPVIHMVHGNVGLGFGSIGIRLVGPPAAALAGVIGGLIVGGINNVGDAKDAIDTGAFVGAGIGVAACVAIDAFGFGYEKNLVEGPAPRPDSASARPSFSLSPVVDVRKNAGTVGVVGRF